MQEGFVAAIIERSDQNKDVYVKFMKRSDLCITWPQDLKNECWIPFNQILCINQPTTATGTWWTAIQVRYLRLQ